ncbi:hypothetical protein MTR67_016982 [Solanum verrucosum]|uniref:non-specific serine/threonine protein kinase n=1 Tax=Solanum verrucosum TaxID=315347 RepID=A0AAF0QIV3_SOLVR|nr:hypothetical protein MTR67_016982 [Solanum verrucosum]
MEKHIFLLILLLVIQYYSVGSSNETDQQALLAFKNLITSPNHFLANNWTKNTSFCSWFGVTCSSKRQRVVALALPNLQIQGTISPSLANLSFLSVLNLENNSFRGGIPYGLGHLPRLRVIDIQNNQLNESIPTSLFQNRRVQVISLAFNELSGEMWRGPWYVPELRVLNLTNNSLTGMIPPSVGNATKMMNFSLSGNRVSGNIPKEIGNLSQLADMSLTDNQLTGSIPVELFNISSLLYIHLRYNSLSGPLLLDQGNIVSNLEHLIISFNQISGCVPSNICQLTELKVLSIVYNNITGEIPKNIDCLSKLEMFLIGGNPIKGTIPTSLGNISTLQYLYCGENHIVGKIPQELGKLSKLRVLVIEDNSNLIGRIPEAIFNISSLEVIAFSFNNLLGRIPTTTGLHLPNLKELYLGDNQLEGEIPLFITNASKLEKLELNDNFLSGTIPTNLGNLHELRYLFLHHNQLTNEPRERELLFFNSLADCKMLKYLQVGFNLLNGVLPNSIGNLSSTIQNFHIGHAHINGLIPTGVIPTRFGELQNLQYLDLSNNSFFGQIPLSFANLMSLEFLNLSSNALSGEIPSGGVFANSTLQSFLGNKGLCGMHILEIPACAINNPGKQSKLKENKGKSKDVEKVREIGTHQLVSYHEIQQATNNFDESNLIGEGSSGSVYKGTLSRGTVVAIKVLDLESEQVCKRFDTECEVMRNVRHRNIVPVITTCSSDYIRAFVLRYMPNGSLENWLYREDCHLNLHQRITIMLDVAMAIEYLHHGHATPIVHCDLKPTNVLLDEDMVAQVGDFGISKILAISKSMAHTQTLGTLGYIAPEYGSEGIVSTSGDVYSYGIMLMEVLTKRRPTDEEIFHGDLDLRKWITQLFSGTMMDVVDANIFSEEKQITSKSEICIASMIELDLDCTKEVPESRITMKEVVKRLNKINNTFLET